MTDSELDAVYTRLCKTMTQLGENNTQLFLARFAMLAITRMADGQVAEQLMDAAAEDISATDRREH